MSFALAVIVGLIGVAVGVGATLLWFRRGMDPVVLERQEDPTGVPEPLAAVLDALPMTWVLTDRAGRVLEASPEAIALGLIAGERLRDHSAAGLVSEAARTAQVAERGIDLGRRAALRGTRELHALAIPAGVDLVLLLLQDRSESRRMEAVRRDFVANVSHELKTPVGALGLLAEAVEAASDDPDQVVRFAARIRIESARLSALIADIVDLSRLQSDDPLVHAEPVNIDLVVAEAVDSMRTVADSARIEVVRGGTSGLTVLGVEAQLLSALRNLIGNAITYSSTGTRVAVGTRLVDGTVEMSVSDQGIGIAVEDQSRIFERFYRVDQARSRGTGGTGLGLAIVKHVCANHGGEVTVWSRPGEGSTFTMRLPVLEGGRADTSQEGGSPVEVAS